MSIATKKTTNHEVIQLWAEDRGGIPASVSDTANPGDVGVLRIHFPGQGSGEALEEISWADFLAKFDEANLAMIYEVRTDDGQISRFSKFVNRD